MQKSVAIQSCHPVQGKNSLDPRNTNIPLTFTKTKYLSLSTIGKPPVLPQNCVPQQKALTLAPYRIEDRAHNKEAEVLSSAPETSEICHGTPPDRSKRNYGSSSPEPTADRPHPLGQLRGRDNRRRSSLWHLGRGLGGKDYGGTASQYTGLSQPKRCLLYTSPSPRD